MEKKVDVKTVFVLGGSGGIGKEISYKFAEEGYNLIIQGNSQKKLEELKNQIEKKTLGSDFKPNINLLPISFNDNKIDLKDYENIKNQITKADVLVLCYGPFLQKEIHKTTEEEWEKLVFWNYTFPGELISYALNVMMEKKYGRIIVFGGTRTNNVNGFRTNAIYAGAKTALCSLVKSVAAEYAKFGITCNAILPGFVETEYLSSETKQILAEKMPSKSLISGRKIANTIFYLVNCREINGALLNIDEGWMP